MPDVMNQPLRLADFEYTLPAEQIAQTPMTPRDHSRLMVVGRGRDTVHHQRFDAIGSWLHAGDVLVLNATRVFPARLRGHKRSGGKVELLLLGQEEGARWKALVKGTSVANSELIFPDGLTARLRTCLNEGEWTIEFSKDDIRSYLDTFGEMPLPPYIKRATKDPQDTGTYQTVFAREEGSVAAPTAGFHFTPELLAALQRQGVMTVEIVLHVGWGTFRPIRSENISEHRMLPERYEVSASAAEALTVARQNGGRIIAVGTTAVRTLESSYQTSSRSFQPGSGSANLFIYPRYEFKAVDALITNFHLPHSTPLLLACAFFGGSEPFSLRPAYREAIQHGYRFYSYGDAMFIQ